MTKKKFVYTFFLLTICSLLLVSPIYAHVLKTDGSIGAVMHIDPEDDPIAGSQSGFFFEFKDKQNKFTPQNCDCTFSIDEQGKEIYSQPLFQNNLTPSLSNASLLYTFPNRDVYQVKIVGKPYTLNSFQPFTLIYDVRVARVVTPQPQANTSQSNSGGFLKRHIPHFIAGAIILLFLIAAILKQRINKLPIINKK